MKMNFKEWILKEWRPYELPPNWARSVVDLGVGGLGRAVDRTFGQTAQRSGYNVAQVDRFGVFSTDQSSSFSAELSGNDRDFLRTAENDVLYSRAQYYLLKVTVPAAQGNMSHRATHYAMNLPDVQRELHAGHLDHTEIRPTYLFSGIDPNTQQMLYTYAFRIGRMS
jgi:hypothetical protein